jgi:molybdate transport system ATP-binding protein
VTETQETCRAGLSVNVQQSGPIPLDAEFGCAPGEVLAMVGPSGSGKSTLLRAIAGLYHPEHGRVAVNGETWFDSANKINLAPQRRSTGFVFQNYALFPHLSAIKNIEAAIGHRARDDRATRAKELLALVNLSGLEARRPRELSGGQQQRVAVARALARDPATLLLDEPFSAVDRATRQKLYVELAELRRALKIPMILVTHDLHEAAMLADRMCILRRGKTLQVGSPVEVMTRPNSTEIARLVDIKNIFEGSVVAHDHERKLTMMSWRDKTLEASYTPQFVAGTPVSWALPMEYVILHRRVPRDRPSRGEHENPVSGRISEYVVLGPNVSVGIKLDGDDDSLLFMTVPTHVAHRNQLGPGESLRVSLLAEGIHLMPREKSRRDLLNAGA